MNWTPGCCCCCWYPILIRRSIVVTLSHRVILFAGEFGAWTVVYCCTAGCAAATKSTTQEIWSLGSCFNVSVCPDLTQEPHTQLLLWRRPQRSLHETLHRVQYCFVVRAVVVIILWILETAATNQIFIISVLGVLVRIILIWLICLLLSFYPLPFLPLVSAPVFIEFWTKYIDWLID